MFKYMQSPTTFHHLHYFHSGPSNHPPSPGLLQQLPHCSPCFCLCCPSIFSHTETRGILLTAKSDHCAAQYPPMASHHPENETKFHTACKLPQPWFTAGPARLISSHSTSLFFSAAPSLLPLRALTPPVPSALERSCPGCPQGSPLAWFRSPLKWCQSERSSMSTV